jgi:hypothetical protein
MDGFLWGISWGSCMKSGLMLWNVMNANRKYSSASKGIKEENKLIMMSARSVLRRKS